MRSEHQPAEVGGDTHNPVTAETMRAIVQENYGGPDTLHRAQISTRNIDHPNIDDNDVLLRVHAAGLDRGTWHVMTGRPYLLRLGFGIRRPKNPVPGIDVAGTIVAVGSAVTKFAAGDDVYGIGRSTFAEYAVARADKLARKPARATFAQAAAVPVSALTALQALRDAGRVAPGQRVLILGASGGVGSYAVQLAKAFGAEVTGACSTAKLDLVRSLGADHVIDYTREDFADGKNRYDLILDIAGNPSLSRLRRALTATGTAVIVGSEQGGDLSGGMNRQLRAITLSPFLRQRLTICICKQRSSDLDQLSELIDSGAVTPCVDRTYPLDQVPDAMRYLATGSARGKVVVII
jgi:NADPH:quinone reductase-like Zn-dependent oxidoreductase